MADERASLEAGWSELFRKVMEKRGEEPVRVNTFHEHLIRMGLRPHSPLLNLLLDAIGMELAEMEAAIMEPYVTVAHQRNMEQQVANVNNAPDQEESGGGGVISGAQNDKVTLDQSVRNGAIIKEVASALSSGSNEQVVDGSPVEDIPNPGPGSSHRKDARPRNLPTSPIKRRKVDQTDEASSQPPVASIETISISVLDPRFPSTYTTYTQEERTVNELDGRQGDNDNETNNRAPEVAVWNYHFDSSDSKSSNLNPHDANDDSPVDDNNYVDPNSPFQDCSKPESVADEEKNEESDLDDDLLPHTQMMGYEADNENTMRNVDAVVLRKVYKKKKPLKL